jgi:hypothetical protein
LKIIEASVQDKWPSPSPNIQQNRVFLAGAEYLTFEGLLACEFLGYICILNSALPSIIPWITS